MTACVGLWIVGATVGQVLTCGVGPQFAGVGAREQRLREARVGALRNLVLLRTIWIRGEARARVGRRLRDSFYFGLYGDRRERCSGSR
jgi:hypothetical protein